RALRHADRRRLLLRGSRHTRRTGLLRLGATPRVEDMISRSTVMLGVAILLTAGGSVSCAASRSTEGPAAPARIYVTNQLDNTASVIDGATHKVVATVPVGVAPAQMAVSPDRRSVYIANTGGNTVSVLDTATNTIARTIALPRGSRPV